MQDSNDFLIFRSRNRLLRLPFTFHFYYKLHLPKRTEEPSHGPLIKVSVQRTYQLSRKMIPHPKYKLAHVLLSESSFLPRLASLIAGKSTSPKNLMVFFAAFCWKNPDHNHRHRGRRQFPRSCPNNGANPLTFQLGSLHARNTFSLCHLKNSFEGNSIDFSGRMSSFWP